MNRAAKHQPPATNHTAKPQGWDIIWSNHAARRMIQRQFEVAEVLNMIGLLCNSGLLSRTKTTPIIRGKIKVVAKEIEPIGNLRRALVVTATHARKGGTIPRHKRKRTLRQEKARRRARP